MNRNEKFHRDIDHLHREIEKLHPSDDEEKKVIERLRYDIDELIEMSKQDPETRDESVIDRLHDSVEKFEVNNPELTRALKQVLDFLSGSGI
jgi:hypothetical protein